MSRPPLAAVPGTDDTGSDRVLRALRERGKRIRGDAPQWVAQCPAHDDRSPSLGIKQVEGQVLIYCRARCDWKDVVAALGLKPADLFDNPSGVRYRYDDGRVVHRRFDARTGRKTFPQYGKTKAEKGTAALYRLTQVKAAVANGFTIYVVEGEKDVHALESIGLAATTAPQGAGQWDLVDATPFIGATVVVADNDEAGMRHAAQVQAGLTGLGTTVTVVRAAAGKDASDHVAAGHGVGDFLPVTLDQPKATPKATLKTAKASAVDERRVVYAWAGRIPIGAPTLLPGEEGIGKTALGIRIMADLTRGTLPGEFYGEPRDVVVVAAEDGIEDVFRPRLREAGADLDRVTFVLSRTEGDDEENVVLPRDLPLLTEVVRDTDAVLVWIDSLVTTMPESVKTISYKDVNGVIKPLGQWADAQRVAVAAPWHLNKAAGTDTALRMMDSRAFRTAVRSLLLVVEDPDAPEGKRAGIVALDKVNAGPSDVPALRFIVRAAHYTVTEPDRKTGKPGEFPASCAVVDWGGEVDGDGRALARELLAPRVEQEGTARQWLRQYLTVNGETARPQVIEDAEAAGHKRTAITNAAQALRVHSREEKGQTDGRPWRRAYWSLPESSAAAVHTQSTRTTGTTGETQQRTSESIPQVSSSGPSHPSRPARRRLSL